MQPKGYQEGRPYLYHQRPPDMVGQTLYPLNMLRDLHPAIYARQATKYTDHPGRTRLPYRVIPKLACAQGDVVQCAPIAPHLLYRALRERGLRPDPARAFFRIPLTALGDLPAVIYDASGGDPAAPLCDAAIAWLDRGRYAELRAAPERTLAWYDRLAREGRIRGTFAGVPHVFVRGPIDVGGAAIIRWGDAPMPS